MDIVGAGGRTKRDSRMGGTSGSRMASVRRREPPCETATSLCLPPCSWLRRVAVMGGEQETHADPVVWMARGGKLDSSALSLLKLVGSLRCISDPLAALSATAPWLCCCCCCPRKRASPFVKVQQILERARRSRLFKAPLARADASSASCFASRTAALTSASLVQGMAGTCAAVPHSLSLQRSQGSARGGEIGMPNVYVRCGERWTGSGCGTLPSLLGPSLWIVARAAEMGHGGSGWWRRDASEAARGCARGCALSRSRGGLNMRDRRLRRRRRCAR